MEAEIEELDLCDGLTGKAESWLDARRAVLHQTLLPFESDTMDLDISRNGLMALALKLCEVRADIRRLDAEVAEHTKEDSMHTESDRLGKLRLRLSTLETERYRMRGELRLVEHYLDRAREAAKADTNATMPDKPCESPAAKAMRRQCPVCNEHEPDVHFRRDHSYNKSLVCYGCEFPKCAACGRQREEKEGPLHKNKTKEQLVQTPWYLFLRPAQTLKTLIPADR